MRWVLSPIFAVVATVASSLCASYFVAKLVPHSPDAVVTVIGTIAQVTVTMMGFILAVLAILATISNARLVKKMGASGHFADLLRTLLCACLMQFLAFVLAVVVLVFGVTFLSVWKELMFGILVGGFASIFQAGFKFWRVLNNLNAE